MSILVDAFALILTLGFAFQIYSTVFAYSDRHYEHPPEEEENLFRDSEIDAAELPAI